MALKHKIFEKLPFSIVESRKNTEDTKGFVFVGPKRYVQLNTYKKHGLAIYNFEARPDDVYVVGYPRTGTTLHCEMIWQIANDLNFEGTAKDFLDYRFPHIDYCLFPGPQKINQILENKNVSEEVLEIARTYQELTLDGLTKRKGKRFIKSHLPLSLMPPHIFEVGAKVIYCARNPKDVLVSILHATRSIKSDRLTYNIKDWFEVFNNDGWLDAYFEHVKEGWEKRNDKNFLFIFYEDTIKDERRTIKKVANFLCKNLSNEQIDSLEDHLDIENFKNNKSVNGDQLVKLGFFDHGKFIRQGRAGDWKELFDEELEEQFNQIIGEKLKGSDLKFPEIRV